MEDGRRVAHLDAALGHAPGPRSIGALAHEDIAVGVEHQRCRAPAVELAVDLHLALLRPDALAVLGSGHRDDGGGDSATRARDLSGGKTRRSVVGAHAGAMDAQQSARGGALEHSARLEVRDWAQTLPFINPETRTRGTIFFYA